VSVAEKAAPGDNEMVQQVKSGSRGKPVQFARMVVGPVYAVDMNQLPKPNLIKNSFTGANMNQQMARTHTGYQSLGERPTLLHMSACFILS